MTTATWSSVMMAASTQTTAGYKAVWQELHDKFVACGLVQTADTGQYDISAVASVPTSTPSAGYRIYQLDDGNATDCFIKIQMGWSYSGATQESHCLQVSIGLGTDGAGTLINATPVRAVSVSTSNSFITPASVGSSLTSYLCVVDGFVGLQWKLGAYTGSATYGPDTNAWAAGWFCVCRTTDDSGDITADGIILLTRGASANSAFSTGVFADHVSSTGTVTSTARPNIAVGADTISTVGGVVPAYHFYALTPAPRRVAQVACIPRAAAVAGDTMSLAMVGVTSHTMLTGGPGVWPADPFGGTSAKTCLAMLFEGTAV